MNAIKTAPAGGIHGEDQGGLSYTNEFTLTVTDNQAPFSFRGRVAYRVFDEEVMAAREHGEQHRPYKPSLRTKGDDSRCELVKSYNTTWDSAAKFACEKYAMRKKLKRGCFDLAAELKANSKSGVL